MDTIKIGKYYTSGIDLLFCLLPGLKDEENVNYVY